MNSSSMGKYKPAIILTLALTVFLVSSKLPGKSWVVSTFAGSTEGYKDGAGTEAQFNSPLGVAVDSSGNVYVADWLNHCIRKITSAGEVSTLAGSTEGYKDATGTAAQFDGPYDVAVDSDDNIYVADFWNHRIRKITPEGVVSTLAGSGTYGHHDATGTAAQFHLPPGVAVDSSGNLYVTDINNHRIRKITPDKVVSTIAGSTEGYKDATGTEAQFNGPYDVAVDSDDNIYVADFWNHRIRKITPEGVVSTLAGSGTWGHHDATGTAAQFHLPLGVAVDSSGNLYVADWGNCRIRKITPEGVVSTLAGSGTWGHHDATGTAAQFNGPAGVAVDSSGNLYVADRDNHRIRKIEYK